MAFHKLPGITMCRAKENYIHTIQWQLIGKYQIRITNQSFMNIRNLVAGIARAVDKTDFHLGMVYQQSQKLSGSISRTSYYTCFHHFILQLDSVHPCEWHNKP